MHLQPTAVPSGREAGPLSPVIAGGPWLGEPRDTGAHLCLVLRRTSRRSSGTGLAVGQGGDPGRPAGPPARGICRAGRANWQNPDGRRADQPGSWPDHRYGGTSVAATREQLPADPKSGARPLGCSEQAEQANNAELAAQWLPATSPSGRRHEVQVSHTEVLDDMRRAGRRIHQPHRQAETGPEAA